MVVLRNVGWALGLPDVFFCFFFVGGGLCGLGIFRNFAALFFIRLLIFNFTMNWLHDLVFGTGIGHSVMLLSICIVCGILLGKIKIFGTLVIVYWD